MLNTPLAVDGYSRFQAALFDERDFIGVPTGFQSLFGRPGSQTHFSPDALTIDIDIMRGNEKVAKAIHRGTNARPISDQENLNQQKYTNQSRIYPLIEEEGEIGAHELNLRLAGENPYSNRSRTERMRMLANDLHREQIRRILRLNELLAADAIINGQHVAISGTTNTDYIYDFKRKATHTITVGTLWDAASPTIMANIDTACDLVRADGHVTPDIIIMGSSAANAFINDASIQATADNRRYQLVQVSSNPVPARFQFMVDAGFIPRGRLETDQGYELWIFTYVDVYTSDAGVATKYMTANKAVVLSSMARFDRYFGPPEMLPISPARASYIQSTFGFGPSVPNLPQRIKNSSHVVRPGMFYFDAYESPGGKTATVRTQSAPIFATTMTDTVVTMTVTS
jgi:hypothetical protein